MHGVDEACLRAAIAAARLSRKRGNEPYGAVLADGEGTILAAAENAQATARDCTAHAETVLVRHVSSRIDRATLAGCTLYASGEPCAMCAGAIYWSGVGRVVYALSAASMRDLGGRGADALTLSCREVLARGARRIEVLGPLLEDEARRVID
jgi:tRNA(Arg) A34 adenosine deaminase TadA